VKEQAKSQEKLFSFEIVKKLSELNFIAKGNPKIIFSIKV